MLERRLITVCICISKFCILVLRLEDDVLMEASSSTRGLYGLEGSGGGPALSAEEDLTGFITSQMRDVRI